MRPFPFPAIAARLARAALLLACGSLAMSHACLAQNASPANAGPGVTTASQNPREQFAPVVAANSPRWTELSPEQQQSLAPLAGEWDTMDHARKKKWLEIAHRFAQMKPEEQQRVQERMRAWVKLTPEQRRLARESYTRAKKLPPEKKTEQWRRYQQLPEEQKKKLAAEAEARKRVAALPSAHSKAKPLPPIKSTPKPVLEKSVTPEATNQSVLQPAESPPAPTPAPEK